MPSSPWDLPNASSAASVDDPSYSLDSSHSIQNLAQLGLQGIRSGKVSVAQAKDNAKKMGLNADPSPAAPTTDDSLLTRTPAQWQAPSISMAAQPTPGQPPNPMSMTTGMPMAYVMPPELTNKTDKKTSTTTQLYKTPQQMKAAQQAAMGYTPGSDTPDPSNPFQQQLKGLNDLSEMNRLQALADSQKSHLDLTPLLALADAQKGSGIQTHLAGSYQAPQSQAQQIMNNAAGIQGKKDAILAQLQEATGGVKGGTQTTSVDTTEANKTGSSGIGATRMQNMVLGAAGKFDSDPVLKQVATTQNSLARASSIMDGKTPVTNKTFSLVQQDMINAVSPGGAATEGKVSREMVTTLLGKLNDIQQRFGDVEDLRTEQPQVFQQLRGLINQVNSDYSAAGTQRVKELAQNSALIPNPLLQATVQAKAKMLTDKFGASQAPAAAPTMIRVKRLSDGAPGSLLESDFDPAKYARVQ